MYVCMYVFLLWSLKVGRILFIVTIQQFMYIDRCPVNTRIVLPKIEVLHEVPQTQNSYIIENISCEFH
jgi:hypothetical protein